MATLTPDEYRQKNNIVIVADKEFAPVQRFSDSGFADDLLSYCKSFDKPTPIQAQVWPIARAGQDMVGLAETGSGKTLAFALPAMEYIRAQHSDLKKHNKPRVLVVAPTRELAQQTATVCEALGATCGVQTVCILGGLSKHDQKRQLKQGAHIIVGTPGRLLDLAEEGCLNLSKVGFFVMDEADRMLDLGFEPAIRAIVAHLNEKRQTLMFSATWPKEVEKLSLTFLKSPVRITIGSADLSASHNITQIVEVMEPDARFDRLFELLNQCHKSRTNRVLIFVLYKKEAARMEQMVQRKGFRVAAIHGDMSQVDRQEALEHFKQGSIPLLLATDVAARGLDIPDVEYVINFTFPLTVEDYIHRIGRTGRAGRKGTAYTFFTVNEKGRAGELVTVLKEANQKVPEGLTQWGLHTKRKEHALYGAHYREQEGPVVASKHIKFDE